MHDTRFFGVIRSVGDRGFVVDRDDDQGRAFIPEREARAAGDLAVGDRVSFGLDPGGQAHDVGSAPPPVTTKSASRAPHSVQRSSRPNPGPASRSRAHLNGDVGLGACAMCDGSAISPRPRMPGRGAS